MSALTAARVRELLIYDPDSGAFSNSSDRGKNRTAGRRAGFVNGAGYVVLSIDHRKYYAHRVAWLLLTGEWPKETIDHINGIRSDNRASNLRDVPHRWNCQNRRQPAPHNTTGLQGVSFDKRRGRFAARLSCDDRNLAFGTYATPEEAQAAYVRAKRQLHEGNTL